MQRALHADPSLEVEDREFTAIVRRVERRERAAERVRLLARGFVAVGGVLAALGAAGFLALAPWGLLSGDPTAAVVLGGLGMALAAVLGLAALPFLAAGVGLRRQRPWGRTLALILGVLLLPWVPVGTVLGGLVLAVLLPDETGALFGRGHRDAVAD